MSLRLAIMLVLLVLLFLPLVACGTVQRVAVPVTETLLPSAVIRLPAEKTQKFIVLTIDDAPSSRTGEIVDLLAAYEAKATFFLHTDQITPDNRPHLERAVRLGHELANHLPADVPAWRLSAEDFATDFAASHDALRSFSTGAVSYYRPARGFYRAGRMDATLSTYRYDRPLSELGSKRRYILASFLPWDASGNKTNTDDPARNARRALKYANQLSANLYPGAIVVFHDGEANGREARLAATFVSLEAFLKSARAQGYELVTLSDGIARSAAGPS